MNRTPISTLAAALLLCASSPFSAQAGEELVDGIRWGYEVENGEAWVWLEEQPSAPDASKVLTVPAIIGGNPVKTLAYIDPWPNGFTSLVISEGIAKVEDLACFGLDCESIVLPNSLTNIGLRAFDRCENLTSIVIPDTVETIGYGAFEGTGLRQAVLGRGIERLEISLFDSCQQLQAITIPNTIRDIGVCAFSDCDSLQTLVIPDSVTNIAGCAFEDCAGLLSVSLGTGVISIGGNAFLGCGNLTGITIPDNVLSIGEFAFKNCGKLENVQLGNGISSIATGLFTGCISLKSIVFGASIRCIGDYAFQYCSQLDNVIVPPGVTRIASGAFRRCGGLSKIALPSSATDVAANAFDLCANLRELTIPGHLKAYDYFYSSYQSVTGVVVASGSSEIVPRMLSGCGSLTSLIIPNSVTNIGDHAFMRCSKLQRLVVPESVGVIGEMAFEECSGLEILYLPAPFSGNTGNLGIPDDCEVVFYGEHTPSTSFTPVPVPVSWLFQHGLALDGDCETAALAPAANGGNSVWECYVCGLDPTDKAARFEVRICILNGNPVITWFPNLNAGESFPARTYVVEGKASLSDIWAPTNAASRFFRVRVGIEPPPSSENVE